ncbi:MULTISPECIES: tRNA 2-thiocytidine(32) synthetase TtcA [Cysteiniphilum]|uniref:tRNA 2-thiocytidine(32) synthetase TtcA n=1 Tax=Cysteiniphilum TaxID=2056696 RepID=UPI001CE292B4|nr:MULTISPECIES: tRNA 2-thiocytidine(32) synthetase TtcA [Cysteiniphilum]
MTQTEKKLHFYITKAIADYKMLQKGDKVMICLSGGKDSFTLVKVMHDLVTNGTYDLDLIVYTLDQTQPDWDDSGLRQYLEDHNIKYIIEKRDTYSVVIDKVPKNKTYCSLCSRLRRGNIYRFARDNNIDKIMLGHHKDDVIESALMSMFYQGKIKSMPAKLLTEDKQNVVIRPMVYCQERDIARFAKEQSFPIIPCNLCGTQENLKRQQVKNLIHELAQQNPIIPQNIFASLSNIVPSHLYDQTLFDTRGCDQERLYADSNCLIANESSEHLF